jgi:hypothetical protein
MVYSDTKEATNMALTRPYIDASTDERKRFCIARGRAGADRVAATHRQGEPQ